MAADKTELPDEQPVIRTVPQPSDLNLNGNVFGGWILSQMDIAGGHMARRVAKGPVATVAVDKMKFYQPINVGDTVSIYAEIQRVGTTSVAIELEVYAEGDHGSVVRQVTEGCFVFVAVGKDGRPRPIEK